MGHHDIAVHVARDMLPPLLPRPMEAKRRALQRSPHADEKRNEPSPKLVTETQPQEAHLGFSSRVRSGSESHGRHSFYAWSWEALWATGRVKNVEPCPSADSAQIRPPDRSTIRAQVASPMPLPLMSLPWRRLKGWKIANAYCASNPCPLSATEMRQSLPSWRCLNTDLRSFGATVLNRVPYKVLEDHHHLRAVAPLR